MIDLACIYAEVLNDLEPKTAADFVDRLAKFFPHRFKIITDSGFEWTDRCPGCVKDKTTGNHPVDLVCKQHNIKHTLLRFVDLKLTAWLKGLIGALTKLFLKKLQQAEAKTLFILILIETLLFVNLLTLIT